MKALNLLGLVNLFYIRLKDLVWIKSLHLRKKQIMNFINKIYKKGIKIKMNTQCLILQKKIKWKTSNNYKIWSLCEHLKKNNLKINFNKIMISITIILIKNKILNSFNYYLNQEVKKISFNLYFS